MARSRLTTFNGTRVHYNRTPPYRRDNSADTPASKPDSLTAYAVGASAKRDQPVYSGTTLRGVATVHKSNAVPVTHTEAYSGPVNHNPKTR